MKPNIKLGINLNCFTNRYVLPEEWTEEIKGLGINDVQFNADLLDPMLPWKIQERIIKYTLKLCEMKDIKIHSSFGGHNHHQNYLGHPDDEVADYYEGFYKRLITQTALLGGAGVGTCYAIMTTKDSVNPKKRQWIIQRAADSYHRIAEYAKNEGLSYLLFETTSVSRETCATFEETDYVLSLLSDTAVPFKLCLDVGHRNLSESHEKTPSNWIQRYGAIAPVIHIQQCNDKGSHHWPFTKEYNEMGDISPKKILSALESSGAEDVLLAFELNHKAFHPYENHIIPNLQESIRYWRGCLNE